MRAVGWLWVGISIAVLLGFGVGRLTQTFVTPDPADPFGARYVEHPAVGLLHIVPGLLFLVAAPLQFVTRIRSRHLRLHRVNGRVLLTLAVVSGVFAQVAALAFPAFGGLSTQLATLVFGVAFLYSIMRGYRSIRDRRIREHREWMIRVFALALGVATIRACIGVSQTLTGLDMEAVFGASFWAGLSINALVAEGWIRWTKRPFQRVP